MQLTEAVDATASASTQISSSAEEMAAGAQEQSSQTAEVAAAMEQMSRTIVETASNATISAEASQEASKKASEGSVKLDESKKGMQRIVTSTDTVGNNITSLANKTEQIGEIAQVIDDIADQTNLLALNAAIEAARAGEHGRGFAVVADEVRKLAENTTKATKEIADTIRAIQAEAKDANISMQEAGNAVKDGLKMNDEVGLVLGDILASVGNVTNQISQVAAASEEQSATAEQVSTNVEAINNVANESAVGVQQIASASEDLNRLTEKLSQLVDQFKINKGKSSRHTQNYAVGEYGNLLEQ
jgi:methyl-accepting chemotaxis protein